MTTVLPKPVPAGTDDADQTCGGPLLLLIASGLLWLVLGGTLALLNLIQVYTPAFLADCAWLTYGRLQAMQETALLYGWAGNAGLAVALWVLARLGGAPLRGPNYIVAGGLFWNLGVSLALVGIAVGDASGHGMFQLPRYVQPFLLFAFAAIAVPGVLAWTGRRSPATYAAQWYAVAALFLFPWFFSVASVMLTFAPVRGTLQAVVATWYAQNVFSLWLAPVAIAAVYYLLPKITGRVIPSYDFAVYGFWSLLFFGCWMGGRLLVGAPVPAWVSTMAIANAWVVLFHHIIVFFNVRDVFRPGANTTLKFLALGVGAYLLSAVIDTAFSARALAVTTQFTHFQQAQTHLAMGAVALILTGALYHMTPRLAGGNWPSVALIRAHFMAYSIGFVLLVGSLAVAGWIQGSALNDPSVAFTQIAARTKVWLQLATAAQALLVVAHVLFAAHFFKLVGGQMAKCCATRGILTSEATVS
ncbi:MAG: hypothetical protein RLZZ129_2602 [Verrucomicrobiota bacterium]|jgi:cytochrome c oxidase cbb3-type subunit 1